MTNQGRHEGAAFLAGVARFEDIEAWKKARELTRVIYRLTEGGAFRRDFGLRDQLRRASVSIMANIAEGFDRRGVKEFHRFLTVAKGSAAEVKSHLYVALDNGLIEDAEHERLLSQADEVGRVLRGLQDYLTTVPNKS